MKVFLKRVNNSVLFEATNGRGHTVRIEGSSDIGGQDSAPSPTELLLMSQAGCTAIDVVELLKKMRQPSSIWKSRQKATGLRTRCQKYLNTFTCTTNYMEMCSRRRQRRRFRCRSKNIALSAR
ncbi:MAG: OsmC family protein [Saprospiraceae bacterium]|nr:OsmC family protein [Candidatus Opimibacter iunctus]